MIRAFVAATRGEKLDVEVPTGYENIKDLRGSKPSKARVRDQFLPLNVDVIPLVMSADPLDRNREIQLSRKDISMIRSSAWIVHRLCDCEGMDHFHFAQV